MLGDLISGVSNFASGLLGQKAVDDQARENVKNQVRFAKKGIQWRVQDALKAGVHPLYALGAQTTSFSPISVGSPLADSIGQMGQDISRAVSVGGNAVDRKLQALQLERASLENDLLRTQIRNSSAPAVGPAMPIGGQSVIDGQQQDIMLPGGVFLPGAKGISSAQSAEDARGEISDFIYGAQTIGDLIRHPEIKRQLSNAIAGNDAVALPRMLSSLKWLFGETVGRGYSAVRAAYGRR